MQYGILITDGGAHPPEKWAVATGEMICPIDPKKDDAIVAKRTQLAVIDALLPHHTDTQNSERAALSAKGDDRLAEAHDPVPAAEAALEAVIAVLKNSPYAAKTEDPEWRKQVGQVLASHFATSANIERQYHCHRNPSEKSKAFLAAIHGA